MKIFSPILKGTTTVAQGTTNLSGSFTGSLFGTAATASYADNFTVGGTLTAQTINVQIITSSIEFNTGSTRNGALSSNTHQFTGSVLMSGNLSVTSNTTNDALLSITSTFADGYRSTLRLSNTHTGGKNWELYSTNTSDGLFGTGKFVIRNNTDNINALVITPSGSILIGTTTDNSNAAGNILHQATNETAAFIHRGPYNIANGGTKTLDVQNGSLIFISENNTGDGALFHACYISATVTIIANPSGRFANTDTASKICVFKSAASGTATLKNNAGSTFQFTTYIIKNSD